MDSSTRSPLSAFKSKKIMRSPAPSDRKASDPNPDPLAVKTPGKPVDPPRRKRNPAVAMSISEIRRAALKLREREPDPPKSDQVMPSEDEEISKPKKPAASAEIKLPEKYELLEKFFNSLDSSIRLLQLKRTATTFANISPQIESLTDRRFTYSHLAQLKFIMPEAIVLEKFLQHDERTSCMRPDIRITLDVDAIKSKGKSKSHSGNLQLRKVFRNRLLDFFKSHPEGDEVPEEELPGLSSRLKENISANSAQSSCTTSMGETQGVAFSGLPIRGSLMPPSFRRSFSQQGSGHQLEKLKKQQLVSACPSANSVAKFSGGDSGEEISENARVSANETCSSYEASSDSKGTSSHPETPVKYIKSVEDEDRSSLQKMPLTMMSTPAKLMSATPTLKPTKRCYMSPDNRSCTTPSKLVRRPPPKRPLKFDTPVKSVKTDDENVERGSSSTRDNILDILPQSLIQSIQEKERLTLMEQEPAISRAMRRRKMIACLPKLFDRVYFFFQSIRRSVITKEELIQKLISQLDIVDRKEVEEQLRLLQELAPEWIHEKPSLSGDLLLCVNKISDLESMRTRLSKAI